MKNWRKRYIIVFNHSFCWTKVTFSFSDIAISEGPLFSCIPSKGHCGGYRRFDGDMKTLWNNLQPISLCDRKCPLKRMDEEKFKVSFKNESTEKAVVRKAGEASVCGCLCWTFLRRGLWVPCPLCLQVRMLKCWNLNLHDIYHHISSIYHQSDGFRPSQRKNGGTPVSSGVKISAKVLSENSKISSRIEVKINAKQC